jgi:hypothetical protein
MRRVSACFISLVLAPLGASAQSAAPEVYSGEYFYNFENAMLTPDGSKECWAIHGDMRQAEIPAKAGESPWGTAHVMVRGTLSAPGHYGNLGACTRVLKVIEILQITDKKARDG